MNPTNDVKIKITPHASTASILNNIANGLLDMDLIEERNLRQLALYRINQQGVLSPVTKTAENENPVFELYCGNMTKAEFVTLGALTGPDDQKHPLEKIQLVECQHGNPANQGYDKGKFFDHHSLNGFNL